jgi:hypothetical protein
MWRTPDGERILTSAEATLVKVAVCCIMDESENWDDEFYHIPVFDLMTYEQKVWCFATVLRALLMKEAAPPYLSAETDATVAVIFQKILEMVWCEIDINEDHGFRSLVISACESAGYEELIPADCDCGDEWEALLQDMKMSIIWDEDYLYEGLSDDAKDKLCISDDYFTQAIPDPRSNEIESVLREIDYLTYSETKTDADLNSKQGDER